MQVAGEHGDPLGILMIASLLRDDAPWLYELSMEVYRALKSGNQRAIEIEIRRLQSVSEFTMHNQFFDELGLGGKESYVYREFPRMLQRWLGQTLNEKKSHPQRRSAKPRSQ